MLPPDLASAFDACDPVRLLSIASSVPDQTADLGDAARAYAACGLRVFPLIPGGKLPMPGTRGLSEATTDLDTIDRWWSWFPWANIGIATGHNLDVLDVDGLDGYRSFVRVTGLPEILGVSITRKDGLHLWMRPTGLGNTSGKGHFGHIDFRGRGGFVVAPPSIVTPQLEVIDGLYVPRPGEPDHPTSYRWHTPITVPIPQPPETGKEPQ